MESAANVLDYFKSQPNYKTHRRAVLPTRNCSSRFTNRAYARRGISNYATDWRESGKRNFSLLGQLWFWVQQNSELGVGFDSSTEFNLPNGGDRSPDVSWVKLDRWNALTQEQKQKFPPICPDFIIELRSETDNLKPLQKKMQEYLDSGLRLGWLIDPKTKKVEIYRLGQPVEILKNPATLSGEDVLPAFVLDLNPIFG